MSDQNFSVGMTREAGYRFRVQPTREGGTPFFVDETPPLGGGEGPTPMELLGASVGACLSSSLLFCLEKSRIPVHGISTQVEGTVDRNEAGRLRIREIHVALDVALADEAPKRAQRCLELFQDFCTVTASVTGGVPVAVQVRGIAGPGG